MVKAFIFDLGNTLIEYPAPEKLRENCARFAGNMRVSKELLNRMNELYLEDRRSSLEKLHEATIEKALSRALKEDGHQYNNDEILALLEEIYHFGFGMHAYPVDGAVQLMEALKARGFKTGIVSNTPFPGSFFKKDLERFGLLHYFQTFVWSSEFGKRKPSPDIFKKALADLRITPGEAVYIGDKLDRDVAGSRGVGMQSIWFDRKGNGKDHDGYRITLLTDILSFGKLFT